MFDLAIQQVALVVGLLPKSAFQNVAQQPVDIKFYIFRSEVRKKQTNKQTNKQTKKQRNKELNLFRNDSVAVEGLEHKIKRCLALTLMTPKCSKCFSTISTSQGTVAKTKHQSFSPSEISKATWVLSLLSVWREIVFFNNQTSLGVL